MNGVDTCIYEEPRGRLLTAEEFATFTTDGASDVYAGICRLDLNV